MFADDWIIVDLRSAPGCTVYAYRAIAAEEAQHAAEGIATKYDSTG
jgi:hypothetical protein